VHLYVLQSAPLDRLCSIGRFVGNYEVGFAVDQQLEALPHHLVILHQEYSKPPVHPVPPADQSGARIRRSSRTDGIRLWH
jgi:hypothetical protein